MKTRNIAFGAMYSAFSVLLLTISVSLSDDPFTLMLSSLPIAFILDEFEFKTAFTAYLTTLVLTFSLFGLRVSVIGFALLFGPYALVRKFVSKRNIFYMLIRWGILIILSVETYEVVNAVIEIHENYLEIITIVLMLASLFMYERLVEYGIIWHRRFFRKFSNRER